MDALTERSALVVRSNTVLDRFETFYLKVLRAALLAVATILLVCALCWAAVSLVRVMRSPDSVVEKPSVVAPSELTGAEAQKAAGTRARNGENGLRSQRAYYDSFVKRYFALYRTKYQPHLRSDDKRLSVGEFDDLTINTAGRLAAIRNGELNFATDKNDLEAFLPVVTQATATQATTARLAKYRLAVKKPTATQVQRTRTETRRGWDSYSTACSGWYESPIGCAVTRRVEVPYTQNVTVMRYPAGISSPNEIIKGYQDRYFELLAQRRSSNRDAAEFERAQIVEGQNAGWTGLTRSVMIAGGFLILMFFFLLVAIERHQRRLTATLP